MGFIKYYYSRIQINRYYLWLTKIFMHLFTQLFFLSSLLYLSLESNTSYNFTIPHFRSCALLCVVHTFSIKVTGCSVLLGFFLACVFLLFFWCDYTNFPYSYRNLTPHYGLYSFVKITINNIYMLVSSNTPVHVATRKGRLTRVFLYWRGGIRKGEE